MKFILDLYKKLGIKANNYNVPHKEGELLQGERLLTIVNDVLSPFMTSLSLQHNDNYLWFGDWNNSIRKVIQYHILKGGKGVIRWGIVLDYLPIPSGTNLKFNRTDKSINLHLFEQSNDYRGELEMSIAHGNGIASHWGENEARRTIHEMVLTEMEIITSYFNSINTQEDVYQLAKRQSEISRYSYHYPDPNYVMSFVLARMGQLDEGIEMLNRMTLHNDEKLREKMRINLYKTADFR
jgi:hypothetical protein